MDQALSHPDGLLAWGGDLHPERLVNAYREGIFPWFGAEEPILWWSPARRCVLFPERIHVARRFARTLRQRPFRITADRAFDDVIAGCARARDRTWITPGMRRAYGELHRRGIAHSVEAWRGAELVGGLYGLALGGVFFGESMFSRRSNASKVALVALCRVLSLWGFTVLDCQVENPHLQRMGAELVGRARFLAMLREGLTRPGRTGAWTQAFGEALEETGEVLRP